MAYNRYGGGMSFGSIPPVVKNLLIINALVFLAQNVFENQGIQLELWGALWGFETGNFKVWQLITYQFMHASLGHIFFNMLTLWMFGSDLENYWGSKRFLTFYILCGIFAGLAQLLLQQGGIAVGASGAIMGLMAGFAYLFPNREIMLYFAIPVKAKYFIPALMALDLFSGIAPKAGDNTAHWAHLGGALAGFIIVILWNKTNRKTFY